MEYPNPDPTQLKAAEWHVLKVLSHKELVILRERAPKLVLVDD